MSERLSRARFMAAKELPASNSVGWDDWMREVGVYDEVTEYSMTALKKEGRNQAP